MNACVSGKTLAFGVPALMHILQKDNKKTSKKTVPRCLVLSPTRELAQQVSAFQFAWFHFLTDFISFLLFQTEFLTPDFEFQLNNQRIYMNSYVLYLIYTNKISHALFYMFF